MNFDRLDDDQVGVVRWKVGDGDLQVVAAAGSGKTTTITALVTKLVLVDDLDPSEICVLTFANKAGKVLRERISASLGEACVRKMDMGTFHGLAGRAIRQLDPKAYPMPKCMNISPQQGRDRSIPAVLQIWRSAVQYGNMPGTNEKSLRCCKEDVYAYIRAVGLDVADGIDVTTARPRRDPKRYREAWSMVERSKEALNAWEFHDLLFSWKKLLTNGLGRKYRVVIVDEAQDNNKIQNEISKLLVGDGGALILVGDARQTIHEWRGAHPHFFRCSRAKRKELTFNYRSGKSILSLTNNLADGKAWSLGSPAQCTRDSAGKIELHEFDSHYLQALTIARQVQSDIEEGFNRSRVVLCRTNGLVATFEAACIEAGLAAKVNGGFSILESWDAKVIIDYMKAICNRDSKALSRVMNRPKRYVPRSFVNLMENEPISEGEPIWTYLRRLTRRAALSRGSKGNILDMAYWLESTSQASFTTIPSVVYTMLSEEHSEDSRSPQDSDQLMVMRATATAISRYPDLHSFITRMMVITHGTADQYLLLSTIHKAKGQEWDEVFVDSTEGMLPHFRSRGDQMEEEERLLYVALSRARDKLHVSYALSGDNEQEQGGLSSFLGGLMGEATSHS